MLLLICCLVYFVYFLDFAIIFKRKRELVALLLLSYACRVTVNVM